MKRALFLRSEKRCERQVSRVSCAFSGGHSKRGAACSGVAVDRFGSRIFRCVRSLASPLRAVSLVGAHDVQWPPDALERAHLAAPVTRERLAHRLRLFDRRREGAEPAAYTEKRTSQ